MMQERTMDDVAKIVSASNVAKVLSGDIINGTPERQEFGKKFELAYQQTCWIWNGVKWKPPTQVDWHDPINNNCEKCGKKIGFSELRCSYCNRRWHSHCAKFPASQYTRYVACESCVGHAIMDTFSELMGADDEASRIAVAFFNAGVRGLAPATSFRQIPGKPGHYVSAKPDLRASNGVWYEFKTYPIREYATAQCKVFSWVIRVPVILVTWDGKSASKTTVDGLGLILPDIPEEYFSEQDYPATF